MAIKVKLHPKNNWLSQCGYTQGEEAKIYDDQLQDIIDNPRWYLDNFEKLTTYRVYWQNYSASNITVPFKLCNQNKKAL